MMELVVRKTDLLRELQLFQGIVERKNTIPILANVLIEATKDGISLLATDLDVGLRSTCEGTVSKPGVLTLPDVLYRYRYHSSNATLFLGTGAVAGDHVHHGNPLAVCYRLGAMRLWAGDPPRLLQALREHRSLHWNLTTLMILVPAIWGHLSPATLRTCLRWSIHARDLVAAVRVKDGRPREWRSG